MHPSCATRGAAPSAARGAAPGAVPGAARVAAPRAALALAIAVALTVAPGVTTAGAQERLARRVDTTFAFGRNGWVDVQIASGTIIVNGWTRPEARVMGRTENGYVVADLSPTRIVIETRRDRGDSRRRASGNTEIEVNVRERRHPRARHERGGAGHGHERQRGSG
jgi:hypothetical protein